MNNPLRDAIDSLDNCSVRLRTINEILVKILELCVENKLTRAEELLLIANLNEFLSIYAIERVLNEKRKK